MDHLPERSVGDPVLASDQNIVARALRRFPSFGTHPGLFGEGESSPSDEPEEPIQLYEIVDVMVYDANWCQWKCRAKPAYWDINTPKRLQIESNWEEEWIWLPTSFQSPRSWLLSGGGIDNGIGPEGPKSFAVGQIVWTRWSQDILQGEGGREIIEPALDLWRFILAKDLEPDQNNPAQPTKTEAYLCRPNGTPLKSTKIELWDISGHRWGLGPRNGAGGSWDGAKGYCKFMPDGATDGRWEIVWMEHQARLIHFRLSEQEGGNPLTGNESSGAIVLNFYDGYDPLPHKAGNEKELEVWNTPADASDEGGVNGWAFSGTERDPGAYYHQGLGYIMPRKNGPFGFGSDYKVIFIEPNVHKGYYLQFHEVDEPNGAPPDFPDDFDDTLKIAFPKWMLADYTHLQDSNPQYFTNY